MTVEGFVKTPGMRQYVSCESTGRSGAPRARFISEKVDLDECKKRDLGLISYKQGTAGVGGFAEKGFCLGCRVALQRALQWHFF